MGDVLTQTQFDHFIEHTYKPSAYELMDNDARFPTGISYAHICQTRVFLIYEILARYLKENPLKPLSVLDIGFFPGTLLRVLKELLGDKINCYGAGLKVDKAFEEHMRPYLKGCQYCEFDPFYAEAPLSALGFAQESMDIVCATEILEHLISPLELIAEGARLLKKGGTFIITTPNVSHIGAVIKLLLGRSNYERLERSPMNLQHDEWRGHIRFYDKEELKQLFKRYGLNLVRHEYYTEYGWEHLNRPWGARLAYGFKKMSWMIPIYREGHFAVFEKA